MAETGQTRTIDSNGNTVVTSSEGLSYTIINNGAAPGVPQVLSQTTAESIPFGPTPQKVPNFEVKQKLLRPALTSHFQCVINPPDVPEIRKYYLEGGLGRTITLLCSDASLPGSSIITNDINDDFTGVTERLGYRRQYDDRVDFTFYVDYGTANGGYNVIRLFEAWIRYAMGETNETTGPNYYYRVRYPDEPEIGYRTDMFIQKFERDFLGNYLEYVFVKAYPIAITSMPVSYNASELLKCTVSFTYNRYILRSRPNRLESEPSQPTATGIPNIPIQENTTFTNPEFAVGTSDQLKETGENLARTRGLGTLPGQVNPGSGGIVPPSNSSPEDFLF